MKKSYPNKKHTTTTNIQIVNRASYHVRQSREYLMWMSTLASDKTKETYDYSLDQFFTYTKEYKPVVKDLKVLLKMKRKPLQELLEDYTIHLTARKISRNTVKLYLSSILGFLKFHDVHYNVQKIKRYFPPKTKPAGSQSYNVEELEQIVDGFSTLRGKSMVLMIASSAMRRGGYANLKVGDLIHIEDCYLIRVYRDELQEYVTFCTPEAREMTEKYLQERKDKGEIITPESDLFKAMTGEKEGGDRARMIYGNIWTFIQKIKMNKEKIKTCKDPRYAKATVHAMRKFCDTMMNKAKIQSNDIEKMMGHKNGLKGLYYDANHNDLFEEYKKAIPYLTILKKNRQQAIIDELKQKSVKDEIVITQEMIDMKQKMESMERKLTLYENNVTF